MPKIELTMRTTRYGTAMWDVRLEDELVFTTDRMEAAFAKVEAMAGTKVLPHEVINRKVPVAITSLGISVDASAVKAATDQLNELYEAAERIGELGRRLRAGSA